MKTSEVITKIVELVNKDIADHGIWHNPADNKAKEQPSDAQILGFVDARIAQFVAELRHSMETDVRASVASQVNVTIPDEAAVPTAVQTVETSTA